MSNTILSQSHQIKTPAVRNIGASVTFALAVWFALVFLLGADEAFVTQGGAPPLALLLALIIPLIVFLAAYWLSQSFREFVLAAELPFLTAIQAWRTGGLGFLALYTYGVLPGYFAWPAGLGDITIGVTALWLGRLVIGDGGVSMMTSIRGGSNAKAKRELGWQPIYPSWRRGFVEGLGQDLARQARGAVYEASGSGAAA